MNAVALGCSYGDRDSKGSVMAGTEHLTGTTRLAPGRDPVTERSASPVAEFMIPDLRLRGLTYGTCALHRPWGIAFPAEGTIRMHIVLSGGAWIWTAPHGWERLQQGDLVLLPEGPVHHLADDTRSALQDLEIWQAKEVAPSVYHMTSAGEGVSDNLACCSVSSDGVMTRMIAAAMPSRLIIRDFGCDHPLLDAMLRAIADEVDRPRFGSATILTRLADLVIASLIRNWAEETGPAMGGLLAAVQDPRLARVLGAIHREPRRRWRTQQLAEIAAMSRSSFFDQFKRVIGQSPAHYAAAVRMDAAASDLRLPRGKVAETAAATGYESEAAFRRAFKRVTGTTPGAERRRAA
jgi:AraC-like DNA-binding protein